MNDETTFELDKPEQDKPMVPAVRTKGALVPRDPFYAYLQEVRKYPALTEEEEKELAIRYKETGDLESAYKLTTANLMLVIKIAMTFKREWQNLMDLIQEGNVGLMKAVKNFDPFRGVRLSAYATWWIKSYILKHILDNWRLVRVGTTNARRKLLFNLKKEKEKLTLIRHTKHFLDTKQKNQQKQRSQQDVSNPPVTSCYQVVYYRGTCGFSSLSVLRDV